MVHAQLHMWDGHSLPPCAPPHCGHPFQHSLILWTFSQCCWAAVTGYWFNSPHIMVHNQVKSEHFNMMTTDEMLKLIARSASSKGSFPADLWQHTSQIVFPPPSLHLQYCRERTPTPHLQLRLLLQVFLQLFPPKVCRGASPCHVLQPVAVHLLQFSHEADLKEAIRKMQKAKTDHVGVQYAGGQWQTSRGLTELAERTACLFCTNLILCLATHWKYYPEPVRGQTITPLGCDTLQSFAQFNIMLSLKCCIVFAWLHLSIYHTCKDMYWLCMTGGCML